MKIIVDAGSTKSHWQIKNTKNEVRQVYTDGINLLTHSWEHVELQISKALGEAFDEEIELLEIYAAGGIREENRGEFKKRVASCFSVAEEAITVESDLVLAAKSLCGDKSGIACILGTGSNSCLWNGREIISNVRPLGYILGDEGSGAVLGKKLIADWYKGLLSEETSTALAEYVGMQYGDVMARIYKEPGANRYLANMTRFMAANIDKADVKRIVVESFTEFIKRNLMQYDGVKVLKVNFVGSIAFYFKETLEECLVANGLSLGIVKKEPLQ